MKQIFALVSLMIFGLSALAAQQSNQELIQKDILGRTFCYTDDTGAGWIIQKNGTSVQHAVNLGMPGPNSYYQLTFVESLRTYGSFDLVKSGEILHFQFTQDQVLIEYQTGRTLSTAACNRTTLQAQNLMLLESNTIQSNSSKMDPYLTVIVFQSEKRGEDPRAVIIGISIRLSGHVQNPVHRELLGLTKYDRTRSVIFTTVTLDALSEIAKIPQVIQISATTQLEPNPSFPVGN